MNNVKYAYNKGYRVTELGMLLSPKNRVRKQTKNKGYIYFTFRHYGKHAKCMVHRLQAFQKYGENLFDSGMEVRHLDGNKENNSYDNIVIGTHSENMRDIPEAIRYSKALYAASFLIRHDKIKIRQYHFNNGSSYKKTMAEFNITSKGTLHFILNSK